MDKKQEFKIDLSTAIDAIESELEYQEALWGVNRSHSPEEWVMYMEDYLKEMKHVMCRISSQECYEEVMHGMRKVVTMGVVCMIQNGILYRDIADVEKGLKTHKIKEVKNG